MFPSSKHPLILVTLVLAVSAAIFLNKKLFFGEKKIMADIERILVISTPTKNFQKVIHYGISLAKKYGADLYILHSLHDPFGMWDWDLLIPYERSMQEDYQKLQQKAKEDIDNIITAEKAQGLLVREFISKKDISDEILRIVEEKKIDLVVMLSHERRRLEHHLFDLDVEQVILKMPCSILLVKP